MNRKVEKYKIPGVSYALTKNGIELPVLDMTNPLFISSIDEKKLEDMIREIAPEARKRAQSFNKLPLFIKRFMSERSYIMAGLMEMTENKEYVTGLSTMMMKLGRVLLEKVVKNFLTGLGQRHQVQ